MSFPRAERKNPKGEIGAAREGYDKAPSSKIQDPDKIQDPNTKLQGMRSALAGRGQAFWSLRFGASLELGVWILELARGLGIRCASVELQNVR
jgi:hypothetical protein